MFRPNISHYIILAESIAGGDKILDMASRMNITYKTFMKYFGESLDGYVSKRGIKFDKSRDADIVERYRQGETQKQIGESYGVCKERIRQILARYNINRQNGGKRHRALIANAEKRRKKQKMTEERIMSSFGCTTEQWKLLRNIGEKYADTPICKYRYQKRSAKSRGIEWKMTLWEWWALWVESGHWENRGLGMGNYVMGRIADHGAYEVGNVEIIKHEDNSKDYYDVHYDEWYEKMADGHDWQKT